MERMLSSSRACASAFIVPKQYRTRSAPADVFDADVELRSNVDRQQAAELDPL
jgi:hypothetical protein